MKDPVEKTADNIRLNYYEKKALNLSVSLAKKKLVNRRTGSVFFALNSLSGKFRQSFYSGRFPTGTDFSTEKMKYRSDMISVVNSINADFACSVSISTVRSHHANEPGKDCIFICLESERGHWVSTCLIEYSVKATLSEETQLNFISEIEGRYANLLICHRQEKDFEDLCTLCEAMKTDVTSLRGVCMSKININASRYDGGTALFFACMLDNSEYVRVLLENDADAKKGTATGYTPLYVSCIKGNEEIVSMLLRYGATNEPEKIEGTDGFLVACRKGHVGILKKLINNGCDVNKIYDLTSPLQHATLNKQKDIVECLIKYGADPRLRLSDGSTAIDAAIWGAEVYGGIFHEILALLNGQPSGGQDV